MKLEKFNKNKKQKRIVIGSIIGILIVIGSIVLIRSYALYEEEKEFNVLKGQIPDFGYDIKMLSVVVDGEKSKSIPSRGLYKTQIDCSNGTRGEWDYNAWNLTLENVSENARCNISFTSNLSEEEYNKYIEAGKALRRNTYRGKDITSYHEDGSLYEMISSGRFDDIYVGDYIVANNRKWLVADIDNYLQTGDTPLTKHHVTIIPAKPLMNIEMNEADTTEGGYIKSRMATETLPGLVTSEGIVGKIFGSHIIEYRNILTSKVKEDALGRLSFYHTGVSSGWEWITRKIDLMSEVNVYGTNVMASSGLDTGIDNRQYAIFQLKPEFINSYGNERFHYWLKSIASTTYFAGVDASSYSGIGISGSDQTGVRPRFLIG